MLRLVFTSDLGCLRALQPLPFSETVAPRRQRSFGLRRTSQLDLRAWNVRNGPTLSGDVLSLPMAVTLMGKGMSECPVQTQVHRWPLKGCFEHFLRGPSPSVEMQWRPFWAEPTLCFLFSSLILHVGYYYDHLKPFSLLLLFSANCSSLA
jgi:hypothetical protein